MTRIISFSNQKGGVGKSTSTINISAILGELGLKILVIDLDPQSNTSMGLSIAENLDKLDEMNTIYECILQDVSLTETIITSPYKNVDVIPSGLKLANAELEISTALSRESLLKDSIDSVIDNINYDYILIDLPPNLGLLNTNGLVASNELIIPVDSVFAVSGVKQLINFIKAIKKRLNPNLDILGVLLNNVDCRTKIAKDVHSEIFNFFGDKLFKNVVRHNIKIQEAQSEKKPINYYDPKCNGTKDFLEIAKEVIERGNNG